MLIFEVRTICGCPFVAPNIESNFDFRGHPKITEYDKSVLRLPRHRLDLSVRRTPQNQRDELSLTEIMMAVRHIL